MCTGVCRGRKEGMGRGCVCVCAGMRQGGQVGMLRHGIHNKGGVKHWEAQGKIIHRKG